MGFAFIYERRMAEHQDQLTPQRIMQFAWGYTATLIIDAALHFQFFERLKQQPRTASELAADAKISPRGARILLNALAGLELVAREGERCKLTPESEMFLVPGSPSFHGAFFRHTTEQLLPKWMQLREVVRTGRPAMSVNSEGDGTAFFAEFVEALFTLSYPAARALGEHLKLAQAPGKVSVLDLAAGSGVWGIGLAHAAPQVHISAVDWPGVLDTTRRVAQQHKVADRLTTIPGDLMEADFGDGHQVAALGHILHSEGVERSQQLLQKTFHALAPGGVIAIMEFLPNDERTGPPLPLIFGVNMLVNTDQGDTFTFAEISAWLRAAGFENPRLLEVPAVSPLILASRPQ